MTVESITAKLDDISRMLLHLFSKIPMMGMHRIVISFALNNIETAIDDISGKFV